MVLTQLYEIIIPQSEVFLQFPYHYGSYATPRRSRVTGWLTSFHTTMVLTQPSCDS